MLKKWIQFLFIILLFLIYWAKDTLKNKFLLVQLIDWSTIVTLTGLLVLTTGIKESSFFRKLARRHLRNLKSERELAVYFIFLTAFLSMWLTNDIALFIVVPLTLSYQEFLQNDLSKLVIFEAISANVGSALTPIGNPQNLFLWHKWDISFLKFCFMMSGMFGVSILILLIFTLFCFKAEPLQIKVESSKKRESDKKLFNFSLVFLIIFVLLIEFKKFKAGLLLAGFYSLLNRRILWNTDFSLIILITFMFIVLHYISKLPFLVNFIKLTSPQKHLDAYLLSLGFSQIISNVPSAILMSKFSHNWLAISYGVNTGGNGTFFSSLANLIALKFLNDKKSYLSFHRYSLTYLLITSVLNYFILILYFF